MEPIPRNKTGNPFGPGVRRTPSWQPQNDDNDDTGDEVAKLVALSKKTLEVQEESAMVATRALATARQTEQLAMENSTKLHAQGEQLDGIHGKVETAGHKIAVAQAKVSYLDKLSDSFLRPIFGGEKQVKEKSLANVEWKAPAGPNGKPLWGRRVSSLPPEFPEAVPSSAESNVRPGGMLGEWADEEDRQKSEMHERVIDESLTQMSGIMQGIKYQAIVMNQEIDRQNEIIVDTQDAVSGHVDRLKNVNKRVHKILNK